MSIGFAEAKSVHCPPTSEEFRTRFIDECIRDFVQVSASIAGESG